MIMLFKKKKHLYGKKNSVVMNLSQIQQTNMYMHT